jgi:hypothetical protein
MIKVDFEVGEQVRVSDGVLCRQAIRVVQVVGEQRCDRITGVMTHVMPADLTAIVRKPAGKRPRFVEQQQAHVFIGVAREQATALALKFAKDHEIILRDNLTHRGGPTVDQFVHHDGKHRALASLEPCIDRDAVITRSP